MKELKGDGFRAGQGKAGAVIRTNLWGRGMMEGKKGKGREGKVKGEDREGRHKGSRMKEEYGKR